MAGIPEHKPVSPLGGVKAFSCPNCGGQVELRAPGQVMTAVCRHCESVLDVTDENFRLLQRFEKKMQIKPRIALGSRGTIDGNDWEVVGFMLRQAIGFNYFWEEYLLFNPYHGFMWLLNQYGHWSLTRTLVDIPQSVARQGTITYKQKQYRKYSTGKAKVVFVLGEFYWEVKRGEISDTRDYVGDGKMLSVEMDANGMNWTASDYISEKEVREIYPDVALPKKEGVAPHQPNPYGGHLKAILPIYLLAIVLLIGFQVFFASGSQQKTVFRHKALVERTDSLTVLGPFEIEGRSSNVELKLVTPGLDNSWFEIEGYLHNPKTNQNRDFRLATEYYYGVSDGESWTEGSRGDSKVLNNVPPGTYELAVLAFQNDPLAKYELSVHRDVTIMSNFWIVLLILTLPVAWVALQKASFKKKKWADAD